MKKLFVLFTITSILLSCQNTKKETITTPTVINNEPSEVLKTISGDGIIRDINLGILADEAVKLEKLTPIEDQEDTNILGYTHDTQDLETIDIFYQKDSKGSVIKHISVDIYPNNEEASKKYLTEITAFYDSKFGKNVSNIWKTKDSTTLTIRNASKGKMQLLNIDVK